MKQEDADLRRKSVNLIEEIKNNRILLFTLLCSAVYLLWFFWLEQHVTNNYHIIHAGLDDYIPFCAYFIVPYLLWFPYVLLNWIYLYHSDKEAAKRLSIFLFTGMFATLFFCTIYPNGTNFRPAVNPQQNIFTFLVAKLYAADTPTNVLPSIHVFNSIGVHAAVMRAKAFRDKPWARHASLVLCILICLSTMFLKQHSSVDVMTACLMAYAVYGAVYEPVTAEELAERRAFRKLRT